MADLLQASRDLTHRQLGAGEADAERQQGAEGSDQHHQGGSDGLAADRKRFAYACSVSVRGRSPSPSQNDDDVHAAVVAVQPEEFSGRIVQVAGSGWDGIDAAQAYVWVRLLSGRERQALIRDIRKANP